MKTWILVFSVKLVHSIESMESIASMESMDSMESMESEVKYIRWWYYHSLSVCFVACQFDGCLPRMAGSIKAMLLMTLLSLEIHICKISQKY